MFNLFKNKNKIFPRLVVKNIEIDGYFTLDEKKIIIDAIHHWNVRSKGAVIFRIVNLDAKCIASNLTQNDIMIVKAFADDAAIKDAEEKLKLKRILGFANFASSPNTIFIVTDRIIDRQIYKNVVIHELGHTVYLPHSCRGNSIMYPRVSTNKLRNQDIYDLIYVFISDLNRRQTHQW